MSTPEREVLPGSPGPKLEALYGALSASQAQVFRPHLLGPTSAEWLSAVLRSQGHSLSASSIRTYRRALARERSVQL